MRFLSTSTSEVEAAKIVSSELVQIWEANNFETRQKVHVTAKVKSFYAKLLQLQKNNKNQKSDWVTNDLNLFLATLDKTYDIGLEPRMKKVDEVGGDAAGDETNQ